MNLFENTVLIEKEKSTGKIAVAIAMLVLGILCVLVSLTILPGLLFIPSILCFVAYYFIKRSSEIEYEYTYIEGELSFDKIEGKKKRKAIARIDTEALILIAKEGDEEFKNYPQNSIKYIDCTSGLVGAEVYLALYKEKDGITAVKFEPNENMLKLIQEKNFRKVKIG